MLQKKNKTKNEMEDMDLWTGVFYTHNKLKS